MFIKAVFKRARLLKAKVMALAVWSTRGWLNPEWAENWAVENAREVAGLERGCSRERVVKHECRSHQVATAATGMQLKWNRVGGNTSATETQRGKWTVIRLRFSCLLPAGQAASKWTRGIIMETRGGGEHGCKDSGSCICPGSTNSHVNPVITRDLLKRKERLRF